MNLTELMREDLIVTDLYGPSKESVLQALIDHLVDVGALENGEDVLRLLVDRENLMTTGVRTGFAIPHAFSDQAPHSLVAFGRIPEGVDWKALDQKPVHFVFLLLGPPQAKGLHLRLLARVSRLLSSKVFVHRLEQARTPSQILRAIEASELDLALCGDSEAQGAR